MYLHGTTAEQQLELLAKVQLSLAIFPYDNNVFLANELFRTLIIFHHNGELVWTDAEVYVYLSKNKLADVMFSARRLQHHEITQHNRITLPIKMVDGF